MRNIKTRFLTSTNENEIIGVVNSLQDHKATGYYEIISEK